jgi:hypothetical protein
LSRRRDGYGNAPSIKAAEESDDVVYPVVRDHQDAFIGLRVLMKPTSTSNGTFVEFIGSHFERRAPVYEESKAYGIRVSFRKNAQ